jgi:lactoylglutathione lyase
MRVNHINLTVDDVAGARHLLEKHFGLRAPYAGKKNFDVLFDDDGMVLTLIGVGRRNRVEYPETFHIGFIQESSEDVDEINRRLREDGYDVEPPSHQHGAWTFYFVAPGGFTVEVLT